MTRIEEKQSPPRIFILKNYASLFEYSLNRQIRVKTDTHCDFITFLAE